MNTSRLVGLCGLAGSGKSTSAELLCARYGWVRLRFAEPIKEMLMAMGLTRRQVDGDLKDVPSDYLCGKTPRYAMQTLGTEWGRMILGEDVWTNIMLLRARSRIEDGFSVVIDDVRFPDEVNALRLLGATIVRIVRPGVDVPAEHASEAHVQSLPVDAVVVNDGSPEDLLAGLLAAITVGQSR